MKASFVLTLTLLGAATAVAAEEASPKHLAYARIDNDILAGRDEGYSSGAEFGRVSPTFEHLGDERLSGVERWLNGKLGWLQPRGFNQNNMVLSVTQQIFTPKDGEQTNLIEGDRPYAAALLLGLRYNSRDEDTMHSTVLHVGVVGPSAFGEQVQDFAHEIVGSHKFSGWDHQLHDEPVLRILHQRYRRFSTASVLSSAWGADVVFHGGGSLGNLATFVNAGLELRLGPALPDNFGSAPSLPVAETTAPSYKSIFTNRLKLHGFLALDVRYVAHDITLDGNTWKDSHSVGRKPLVADLGVGIAGHWRGWKIALARYFRTHEFNGQEQAPQVGSLTFRREL